MLIIRNEQMKSLNVVPKEGYEEQLRLHIKEEFPDVYEQNGDEKVRKNIKSGMKKAELYEISKGEHVAIFIYLMLLFGANFDEESICSETHKIFKNKDLAPNEKLSRVLTYKRDQLK